ncbi:MAG: hypothetical protein JSU73_10530 [candidate division WOR-3 bacterium]|nr:MAG: hypothetical protein JSU73_10530 [candidate division WOR-3 bacterium]
MKHIVTVALALFAGIAIGQEGAKYLVIAHDNYLGAVQPLAEWRRASGVSTVVVPTSVTGTDTASIRRFIEDAWSNWPVPPEFVLIVASASQIRTRLYGWGHMRYYSDNYFADLAGDVKAEIAVGRFPCRTVAEAELLVAKTLAYEYDPYIEDSSWMLNVTTIVREDNDPDDTIYWGNARNLARLAGEHGFIGCDSLSTNRGHTTFHVMNAVNRGTGFVMYRGTAGGWWRYPFDVDPWSTANGRKLPIVLSITCETMSLSPYDQLLGENWMYAGSAASPKGAVAFFGNTHSGFNVARQRGAVARGIGTGLFDDELRRLGPIALRAKLQLISEFPSAVDDYRGFNLYGDPCMPVWTGRPLELAVEHPREILRGEQEVDVTVTCDGLPVAAAVVCASMDSTVWTVATTDVEGRARLGVAPADTGAMRLVVTGQNLLPHDGTIPVVTELAVADPAVTVPWPVRVTARPSVTAGTVLLSWSGTAAARLEIRDNLGRTVRTIDPAGRTAAVWDGQDDRGRSARAGVYFCRLSDEAGHALGSVRLLLAD